MGTSNFHYVNASMCFAVLPDEGSDDFYWYDCHDDMIELFIEAFGKDNIHEGGKDHYELRSFPSRCVVQGRCPDTGNWITAVLRSGYYEGCCWDWVMDDEDSPVSQATIDKVETIFGKASTDKLVKVATFSNGETIYNKVN